MAHDRPEDVLIEAPAMTRRLYGARAEKGALSAVALQVLVVIAESPDAGLDEIARRLALDASTVRHAIGDLRKATLIAVARAPEDGRLRTRGLTREGQQRADELVARAQAILQSRAPQSGA